MSEHARAEASRRVMAAFEACVTALEARMSAEAATAFAGTARARDGGIDLYVTVADAKVNAIVQEVSATVPGVSVHVIDGLTNNLVTLESVRDAILAGHQSLQARGINVVEFGVHTTANRVRVGVNGLTPDAAAYLNAEFGADRLLVFEGGEFAPP